MLVDTIFARVIKTGDLTVRDWRGNVTRHGDGTGVPVTMTVHDSATARRLFLNPYLALGEAYMDGRLTVDAGDIARLLEILGENMGLHPVADHWLHRAWRLGRSSMRRALQYNPVGRARRNAAHHYDLSGELYGLFLDTDRQYSCAYFEHDNDSLERAQEQKKRHIAAKLLIEPGMRVLDIGCGWGGMALYLAQECGAEVVGLTLSGEQAAYARKRVADAGLESRIDIRLQDYRDVEGSFDRIVSVGMFEHVGINHYQTYFNHVRNLLTPSGVALIHSIGRADGPGVTNPWIAKYIFPGGYTPAVSEVTPHVERAGLTLTDMEIWRLHYAKTLALWRARFLNARDRAAAIYDERFCRMWEFYLAGSEMAFRFGGHIVMQLQLSPDQGAVPLTRDYIGAFKKQHPVKAN